MSESDYYAREFDDADLDALADSGKHHLDESGFFLMPTQNEMQELALDWRHCTLPRSI
jgi:hypothetical protein